MSTIEASGRINQKMRTRKALIDAASRLMAQFREPTLDEIAEEALVSRATAYRYFPNVEALLVEASVDIGLPKPDEFFRRDRSTDAATRLERADAALDASILANETALRRMMIYSLQQGLAGEADMPKRQNRRTAMIEAALEPARGELKPQTLPLLKQALALVLGTEAMLVTKDVLGLDEDETRRVKRWAIRALVEAAKK